MNKNKNLKQKLVKEIEESSGLKTKVDFSLDQNIRLNRDSVINNDDGELVDGKGE